jgi:hypothetical protein
MISAVRAEHCTRPGTDVDSMRDAVLTCPPTLEMQICKAFLHAQRRGDSCVSAECLWSHVFFFRFCFQITFCKFSTCRSCCFVLQLSILLLAVRLSSSSLSAPSFLSIVDSVLCPSIVLNLPLLGSSAKFDWNSLSASVFTGLS